MPQDYDSNVKHITGEQKKLPLLKYGPRHVPGVPHGVRFAHAGPAHPQRRCTG